MLSNCQHGGVGAKEATAKFARKKKRPTLATRTSADKLLGQARNGMAHTERELRRWLQADFGDKDINLVRDSLCLE